MDSITSANKSLPLVSIVMATYNGTAYLPVQLASIKAQTYPQIEIIIGDDGSTDGTRELLLTFQQENPEVQLLFHEQNLGYIRNFESICKKARGEWIALCDQDDYWFPEKIEKMQQAIGDAALLYCDSMLCNEQLDYLGTRISDRVNCLDFTSCLQQAVFCRIYGHATLIKRSLVEQAIPFLPIIPHDWWLCYHASLQGGMVFLNEPLVKYRQHGNNVFGVVGGKSKKVSQAGKKEKKQKEINNIRERMATFHAICPDHFHFEKKVLQELHESYSSFSIGNNWKRMLLFLRYNRLFLASKKRSGFRRLGFSLKMFVKIK